MQQEIRDASEPNKLDFDDYFDANEDDERVEVDGRR
jgi:hypothetical protein